MCSSHYDILNQVYFVLLNTVARKEGIWSFSLVPKSSLMYALCYINAILSYMRGSTKPFPSHTFPSLWAEVILVLFLVQKERTLVDIL